jgi:O-antigen/teichoic acid export membrane protein
LKKLRELFSDTLVYGISSVAARFINYLLVPFYTAYFAPGEYGIISLIFGAMIFLNVVFTFGMESAYLRYAAERSQAKSVFRTLQLALLSVGGLLLSVLWLFKPLLTPLLGMSSIHHPLYLMMMGILIFDSLSAVPFAELRLVRRAWTFAILRLINVLINVGLNIYLVVVQGMGIEAVLVSNLIASGLTMVAVWLLTINMWNGVARKELLRTALKFGLPYVPTGIGYAINEALDRFFLQSMPHHTIVSLYGSGYNPEAIIGIYSACYKLAVFMLLFIQMFRMAWQPFFLRHADDEQAPVLFRDVFRYFNLVSGIIFVSVCLFSHQIVALKVPVLNASLINHRFWLGLFVVPYLMMAYWFQGWYVNFTAGLFIREETKKLPVITLTGALVTVILNIILVPYKGMLGAAIATVGSYFVMAVMIYYFSQSVYHIPYQMLRAVLMVVVAIIVVILGNEYATLFVHQITVKVILWLLSIMILLILGLYNGSLLTRIKSNYV